MGIITISKIFTVIITPLFMSQLSIKHFTTLVRWNTVYHSIKFSLNTFWWDHQLFCFFQGCCGFPSRSFYYHPSIFENLEKCPTSQLIPPSPTIKHKRVKATLVRPRECWCFWCSLTSLTITLTTLLNECYGLSHSFQNTHSLTHPLTHFKRHSHQRLHLNAAMSFC